MFYRSYSRARRAFFTLFTKSRPTHKQFTPNILTVLPLSFYFLTNTPICAEKQVTDNLLQKEVVTVVSVQQLVKLLHEQSGQNFVVIVYNKFDKTNHPQAFGLQLRGILQQCRDANVSRIYAISCKDEEYLRQIERRVKNQPVQPKQPQQKESKSKRQQVIDCYYKSPIYSQAFHLTNSKQYSMSQQIKQIKHFQIRTNSPSLHSQIIALNQSPFDIHKHIVVKQCRGKGQCVQSYKQAVKRLIDSGLLIRKAEEYQFELVIDYPTGILSTPSDYIKNFQACVGKVTNHPVRHKKEETYLFSRDLLGKEVRLMSEWFEKEQNNYDDESLLMMFIRPRVNIISKLNTLTDLQWYFLTNRLSRAISLSVNNTDRWKRENSRQCVQVLRMLLNYYPQLNLMVVNSTQAGDIIKHVHGDHKYVIFEESGQPIWNKKFIGLDELQKMKGREQKQRVFRKIYKQQLDSFIKHPSARDLVVVEKQLEISLQRLKHWKDSKQTKNRVVRVCEQRCLKYLDQAKLSQLQEKLDQKLRVYWIDNRTQNIGVKAGDYLLRQGRLSALEQILSS